MSKRRFKPFSLPGDRVISQDLLNFSVSCLAGPLQLIVSRNNMGNIVVMDVTAMCVYVCIPVSRNLPPSHLV